MPRDDPFYNKMAGKNAVVHPQSGRSSTVKSSYYFLVWSHHVVRGFLIHGCSGECQDL